MQKAKAPAAAEEISLLPVDLKSATTFVTVDTILLCCSAMNSEGSFAVRSHHLRVLCAARAPVLLVAVCVSCCWQVHTYASLVQKGGQVAPEVEELVLSSSFLCYVLSAAESLLARTLNMCLSHTDLAAAWTASPEVRKATEQLLGVPDWHTLSQPLLRACLVRRCCTFRELTGKTHWCVRTLWWGSERTNSRLVPDMCSPVVRNCSMLPLESEAPLRFSELITATPVTCVRMPS